MSARRFFVPEVVQTSTMDCGPAALKSLLDGHGVPVAYGRLREACQTDVDGTSIDTVEVVANQLGLLAEQVMVPVDHAFADRDAGYPALVVVRNADTSTHFVVVWARRARWLQVMDPASGRRWVPAARFHEGLHRHEMAVTADAWRACAASTEFGSAIHHRLALLRCPLAGARSLLDEALRDSGWFAVGALDAAVRLVASMAGAGGVRRGAEAEALVASLFRETRDHGDDIFRCVPAAYWSVVPDATNTDPSIEMLRARGAVLLRISGLHDGATPVVEPLSRELSAALAEKPVGALRTIATLLREERSGALLALLGAIAIASSAVVLEALLFRGLFDVSSMLALGSQRLVAMIGLIAFMGLLLAIELPIAAETLRLGRRLETRLRMLLLERLPLLQDRYFQSRAVSDMADRSHAAHVPRNVPSIAVQLLRTTLELLLTTLGIAVVAPSGTGLAIALVVVAIVVPLLAQPAMNERDLRVRNQSGALAGFYLDALLGLVPIRAHAAERNVRRQHESLLVEWAASMRGWIAMSCVADGLQLACCAGLAGWLLLDHFARQGGAGGADLLLVFWTLKLPAAGGQFARLVQQVPAQRNVLMRLMEPLAAPLDVDEAVQDVASHAAVDPAGRGATRIDIVGGGVVAAGHAILHDVDLAIAPGEHVAVVGTSGAGKSSLLGLLLGWHRLAAGSLRIDGRPVDAGRLDDLRRTTAWVDPAVQLWNRSFVDNLAYAIDDDGLARIGDVMEAAHLRGIVEKLPSGLQTLLGEGGALLSGGEGQRVRLGRALMMRDVRLALLDEPFRGLDRAQRQRLLVDVREWWSGVTMLCVTHDVRETMSFDRVVVVHDGRVVEDGCPRLLAATSSRYRALLDAEEAVEALWDGDEWRRIAVREGRLHEVGARR